MLEQFKQFAKQDERFHIVEPNYEGVRISFADEEVHGWLLIRMSLHDPLLAMNLEANEAGGVAVMEGRIRQFFEGFASLEKKF